MERSGRCMSGYSRRARARPGRTGGERGGDLLLQYHGKNEVPVPEGRFAGFEGKEGGGGVSDR